MDIGAKILGNNFENYMMAFKVFVALAGGFWLFQKIVLIHLESLFKKTKNQIDDQIIKIVKSVHLVFFIVLALLISLKLLEFSEIIESILFALILILVVFQTTRSLQILIDFLVERFRRKRVSASEKEAVDTVSKIFKGSLWVIGVLVVVQNMGVEVTSLIAGLGIGGVAIAFALQNILGDLFSSFAIIFDKPFEPGDFIVVGDYMGVVQDIGIKTTRIKALRGEEIVISNTVLTSERIRNYKKMKERRVVFKFGILYETDSKKVKKIPQMIESIIKSIKMVKFDRAHFYEFGDSALNFEVVYFVKSGDYNKYMDIHQDVLIKIKERFDKEKIEIAFPSQTIYLPGK